MFSRTELEILYYLYHGASDAAQIAESMGISRSRVYAAVSSLRRKGVFVRGRALEICPSAFAIRLYRFMSVSPGRSRLLADSGIQILLEVQEVRTAAEIAENTGISKPTVSRFLRFASSHGAVWKMGGGKYRLNGDVWPELRALVGSIADEYAVFDPELKVGSVIYRRGCGGILYSYPAELEDRKTAFSAFSEYGFDGHYNTYYYTTGDGNVDINRAFDDAYCVTKAEDDYRLRMALMLFYILNRERIVPDPEFKEISGRIESGEKVPGWPTARDLRDRLEVYQ